MAAPNLYKPIMQRCSLSSFDHLVLLGTPLTIPLYMALKWVATNGAIRRSGEQIAMFRHANLHRYLFDFDSAAYQSADRQKDDHQQMAGGLYWNGGFWGRRLMKLTQPSLKGKANFLYWIISVGYSVLILYFLWVLMPRIGGC